MKPAPRFVQVIAPFILAVCLRHSCAAADKTPLSDLPRHAMEQSQITTAGSQPFHLRAKVVEATNHENDSYKAEIEEYWAAPDKWKRTVKAAGFSQTLIVNGQTVSDEVTGEYYPNWLRTLVNAIFDPGAPLQGIDLSKSSDNPVMGGTKLCRRFGYRIGIPPVSNTVFATYCFDGGLLDSIGKPGYHAEYGSYKKFNGRQVARKVREYIEPGTELEASIEELDVLRNNDEKLFAAPPSSQRTQTVEASEAWVRQHAIDAPAMQWPAISSGKASGALSIYICIDRGGKIRETYALNSDHPSMSDAARKQLMTWRFKPEIRDGVPVQLESILTFAYETRIVR
jgi:hypothetical protein